MATGGLLGAFSGWLGGGLLNGRASVPMWTILGCILALLAFRELGWVRFPLPQRKWQIPASMVQGSAEWAATVWGSILGTGGLTYLRFSTFLAVQMMIFAQGSVWTGLLAGGLFGFSRTWIALWNPVFLRSTRTDLPSAGLDRFGGYGLLVHKINGWSMLTASAVMVLCTIPEWI